MKCPLKPIVKYLNYLDMPIKNQKEVIAKTITDFDECDSLHCQAYDFKTRTCLMMKNNK